jgi:LysM repeat protein
MRHHLTVLTIAAVMAFTAGGLSVAHAETALARPAAQYTTIGYHTVSYGQTIYCIARGYGVNPHAIAAVNGLVNPNYIFPGQVLAIPNAYAPLPPGPTCPPAPGNGCTCQTYHTVLPGETLYRIAVRYGVTVGRIASCNGIANWNLIYAYSNLCIPAPY